jgi:nitrite reductase/ring-hydroxylating ferredoxin subunit
MTANYPTKCWYVAATSDELGDAPLGRRLLGHDVVLWRSPNGRVLAFDDRCAHRGFPLSDGHVDGDRLVCGYHGCAYDADGRCVHVPTQSGVPSGMRVRVFPILEVPPFIWIWPGPPAAAPGGRPPRTPWLNDRGWSSFSDTWRVRANYLMVHEHYLDFSYAPVVYREDVPPGIERLPAFNEFEYARTETGTFASPAMHIQRWELEADGTTYANVRTHAITPETETATHVFMYASYNYAPNSATVATTLQSLVAQLVDRDTMILERVAAHTGYDGWRSGIEFQADAAALRARNIVAVMLAKEAGRSGLRPGWAKAKSLVTN